MADRDRDRDRSAYQSGPRPGATVVAAPTTTSSPPSATAASTFLQKIQLHAPNSSHLFGFLTLLISGSIFLVLSGITVTATVLGLIFFAPLIIVSSPIWVPAAVFLFVALAGFVLFCGVGLAIVAGLSWVYSYFRGMHPPGSDRVDYARSRIYDTASQVKDYASEYGGYWKSKVKDAAPGA